MVTMTGTVFTWENRRSFVLTMLARGGSDDVRQLLTDSGNGETYTKSFRATAKTGDHADLTGCPWSNATEYNTVYDTLIDAGCVATGMTRGEIDRAHANAAAGPR